MTTYSYISRFQPIFELPPYGQPCPSMEGYGVLQEKIRQVHEDSQAPLALAILTGLATSAFVIQPLASIRKPNGQTVPTSLFCISIAESGERKSTVFNSFTNPIISFLADLKTQDQSKIDNNERDLEVWKAIRKQLINSISKAALKETTEKMINDASFQPQLEQLKKRLRQHDKNKPISLILSDIKIMGDATPAAIANYISRQKVKSLGVLTSEGDEFFSRGIKQDPALFNSAWSGDATQRYRATKGDQSFQSDISIGAAIQPLAAEAIFNDRNKKLRNTGFAARVLFCFPTSNQGLRTTNQITKDDPRDEAYQSRVKQLLTLGKLSIDNENLPKTILEFTSEAREKWFQLQGKIEFEMLPNRRYFLFRDHASKLADNISRVAGILNIMEHGLEESITLESLNQAIDICMYCSDEFLRLFNEPPQEEVDTSKLNDWFYKKYQAGYRYICKSFVLMHGPLKPVARLDIVLNILLNQQIIGIWNCPRYTATGRLTKPKVVIDLCPSLQPDNIAIQQAIHAY